MEKMKEKHRSLMAIDNNDLKDIESTCHLTWHFNLAFLLKPHGQAVSVGPTQLRTAR